MNKINGGFTLIELMVTLVVLSILVAIAYPSYSAFTARSQRATAKTELTRIAQLQERFFIDNRTYATLAQLGFAGNTVGVNRNGTEVAVGAGIYNVTITPAPTAINFIVQATATGTQISDTGCTTLSISAIGVQSPADCW